MARHREHMEAGVRRRRIVRGVSLLTAGAIAAGVVAGAQPVDAFKPYTHNKTGDAAYADVVADGMVTIEGRTYGVDPTVVDALRDWAPYYNAGVVGPDGFPDLVMGQQIVHPQETGAWLDYILTQAWAAQTDPSYDDAERGQILAFAYGFLTHAAGDVWAHTLVNEFAGETFPEFGDVITDKGAAEIALRHFIVEGYIGDATEGSDGNPNRTTVPGSTDVSDDETPGVAFGAPIGWIHDTLVDRDASRSRDLPRCADRLLLRSSRHAAGRGRHRSPAAPRRVGRVQRHGRARRRCLRPSPLHTRGRPDRRRRRRRTGRRLRRRRRPRRGGPRRGRERRLHLRCRQHRRRHRRRRHRRRLPVSHRPRGHRHPGRHRRVRVGVHAGDRGCCLGR